MPVFAAFGSYFCLSRTFTFPRTLRCAEHQNLALSIFTVKLFFSGPRIRIIAEDNANAEDAVTYRCNTQVLKLYCLFRAETQRFFFLSNDSLAYEKIRQKNPQYQLDNNRRLISIKIKRCEFDSYRFIGN